MDEAANDRIKQLIAEYYHNNISEFCRKIGVKQPVISNIISGRRTKPSFDLIFTIAIKASINLNWLVLGEGSMFRGGGSDNCQECSKKDMELRILNEQISAKNTLLEEKDKRLREKDEYIELMKRIYRKSES